MLAHFSGFRPQFRVLTRAGLPAVAVFLIQDVAKASGTSSEILIGWPREFALLQPVV